MRHPGPRVAKHLSEFVKHIVEDGIVADFTWHGQEGAGDVARVGVPAAWSSPRSGITVTMKTQEHH